MEARFDIGRKYGADIGPNDFGNEVVVAGWVQDIRNIGKIGFIQLRDRTGIVQVTFLKNKDAALFDQAMGLQRESVIAVRGEAKKSDKARGGFEVIPTAMQVLGKAEVPLPMGVVDKVNVELETRLDNRFMDLRRPEVMAVFKIRNTILRATRSTLEGAGFIEVNTPKIVATATEGGTSLFTMRYFDKEAFLNQSPQLFKQILMATGLDRIYEIGPAFRAEEHDTVRHINEFTSVDIEMAFSDENTVMELLEKCLMDALVAVNDKNKKELTDLNITLEVPKVPLARVTYTKCHEMLKAAGTKHEWGEDLSMENMKTIIKDLDDYYFITEWPAVIKPFYAQPYEASPDDKKTSRAFDLMFKEKELASGAQRVNDIALLSSNIQRQGLDPKSFDFYLKAFRFGMPPHSGWAFGSERMTMVLTKRDNVRECVLFPRDRYRLVP